MLRQGDDTSLFEEVIEICFEAALREVNDALVWVGDGFFD